jgi:hypothetical protein
MKTRVLALILVMSTSSVAVAASGQEIEPLSADGVITHNIRITRGVSAGAETLPVTTTMAESSLPDAPLPRLNLPRARFAAAGQQPGQSRPAHRHWGSQRDIVVGVIIVIAVVGAIVIATQRD